MDINSEKFKQAAKTNWGGYPCGSNTVNSGYTYLSREYFEKLDYKRRVDEPWMEKEYELIQPYIVGKNVLEIGYGMGRDHLELVKRGAILSGIDITPQNLEITRAHLDVFGYTSDLYVGDAENLPFKNNQYDFVYSFGVLHHTPNMEKAIQEVYRVLKPGGRCWIGLYNKNSLFYRGYLVPRYFLEKQWLDMSLKERLSLIEYPNINREIMVRVTTKRELYGIFNRFKIENIKTRSLNRNSFLVGKTHVSNRMLAVMEKYLGWYNIVIARK